MGIMNKRSEQLGRREFLKKATQAAATRGGFRRPGLRGRAGREDRAILADAIPSRVLGKTGLKLPILGYGGAALPKAWLNPLSREDRVELVRYAYDRGVRYFDTSRSLYGERGDSRRGAQRPAPPGVPGDESRDHPAG